MSYFANLPAVRYAGPESREALAFRFYDKDRVVRGRSMAEHLRVAVCYWHTFSGNGADPFGDATFQRPWFAHNAPDSSPLELAKLKAAAAFEFMERLGAPFFTFHDRDVAPEGATWRETRLSLDALAEVLQGHMERTGIRLLWGTANLFSHPRYAAGAATSPDPEVFACAAAQVKQALEVTHRLGGANYVLWGGREGYSTLLNTDLRRELEQLARFFKLVVEHKHKIGFQGPLLIEPKPHEPTKHQYDFDAATVDAFLHRHGLTGEFRLNIEANHAELAGHSFHHEVAYAARHGLLGSIDINRGDPQLGWDTDQMPSDPLELALVMAEILRAGGLGSGGFNFDAKVRRESTDAEDLLIAHVHGMDVLARALLIAHQLLEDGVFEAFRKDRYSGWESSLGRAIEGGAALDALAAWVDSENLNPQPRSGKQELLERLLASYL
jgi:xylose isomerase